MRLLLLHLFIFVGPVLLFFWPFFSTLNASYLLLIATSAGMSPLDILIYLGEDRVERE